MKRFLNDCWAAVMDNQRNPLRHLDMASQHYFMQVLGWMWSMVFSLMAKCLLTKRLELETILLTHSFLKQEQESMYLEQSL